MLLVRQKCGERATRAHRDRQLHNKTQRKSGNIDRDCTASTISHEIAAKSAIKVAVSRRSHTHTHTRLENLGISIFLLLSAECLLYCYQFSCLFPIFRIALVLPILGASQNTGTVVADGLSSLIRNSDLIYRCCAVIASYRLHILLVLPEHTSVR